MWVSIRKYGAYAFWRSSCSDHGSVHTTAKYKGAKVELRTGLLSFQYLWTKGIANGE